MKPVFADTVFYLGLLNSRDQFSARARAFIAGFAGRFVTTTPVLAEVANFVSRSPQRLRFFQLWNQVHLSPVVHVVCPDELLWQRAADLYASRTDKDWSLTDCLSFLVMEDWELSEALTADHHFEQAGFTILLK